MQSINVILLLITLLSVDLAAANISGVVTDESGKAVTEARIDHTGTLVINDSNLPNLERVPGQQRTDVAGRFWVTTDAPAIVVRKPGYESQRLLIHGEQQVSVTLRHIPFLPCRVNPPPRWKTKKGNDVDYTGTWFVVKTKTGKKGIISGSGPNYSFGSPSNSDVWTSLDYFELIYPDGVIDARGRTSDGKYWRSKTVFGAAAQYYDVDQATAEKLDCVMNTIRLQ